MSGVTKFYVAVGGAKPLKDYILFSKAVEDMGFDRIYVYDDLMFRQCWPVLTLIGEHTKRIEFGPCLVNGFFQHPALIASNAASLDEMSKGRFVLGVGRGAFLDFLKMDTDELKTRLGCKETIELVRLFLKHRRFNYTGKYFAANEHAMLRFSPVRNEIPLVIGSWNEKMATLAGNCVTELQSGEVWDLKYINTLYNAYAKAITDPGKLKFSLGGITCIDEDEEKAMHKAKEVLAVYLPYLRYLFDRLDLDGEKTNYSKIEHHSKRGEYDRAAKYISEKMVKSFTLAGTARQVLAQLKNVKKYINLHGINLGPPYGLKENEIANLEYIYENVVKKFQSQSAREPGPIEHGKGEDHV